MKNGFMRSWFAASTVLLLGLAGAPAWAEPSRPCAEDLAKYCSGISPGSGRLFACYEQQKKNMSGKCVAWAENLKKNAGELKAACANEIDQGCNLQRGDPMAMLDCLQSHYVDLSPKCVNELNLFKYSYPKPSQ